MADINHTAPSYVCRVRGNGAQPRLRDGDYLVVTPERESNPGDEVLVVLKNGQRSVRELVAFGRGQVVLRPIGETLGLQTLSAESIERIDYIVGIARSCVDDMACGPEVRT